MRHRMAILLQPDAKQHVTCAGATCACLVPASDTALAAAAALGGATPAPLLALATGSGHLCVLRHPRLGAPAKVVASCALPHQPLRLSHLATGSGRGELPDLSC